MSRSIYREKTSGETRNLTYGAVARPKIAFSSTRKGFVWVLALGLALTLGFSGCEFVDSLLSNPPEENSPDTPEDGDEEETGGDDGLLFPPVAEHPPLVGGAAGISSIKEKFAITAEGTTGVTETFNALSAYIKTAAFSSGASVIQLGDYIDLEGGLEVAAYGDGGGNFSISTNMDLGGGKGDLLRLIVVGINSFHSGRGAKADGTPTVNGESGGQYTETANNGVPHAVFQFQNVPVFRRVHSGGFSVDQGYANTEIRRYLTPVDGDNNSGKFLAGLTAAGVPADVMWAPLRHSSNYAENSMQTARDLLWLPTRTEMRGETPWRNENLANQTRLEYYTEDTRRIKYNSLSENSGYWMGTPDWFFNYEFFAFNDAKGGYDGHSVTWAEGVAPAFCVK